MPAPASVVPTVSPEVLILMNAMSQEMSSPRGPDLPAPLPGTDDGWVLHVVRAGGLTGGVQDDFTLNSLGHFSCAVSGPACPAESHAVPAEPLIQLTSMIMQTKSLAPDTDSVHNSVSFLCSDCVTRGLSIWRRLSGQESFYIAGWDVTTSAKIPPDLLTLYDAVMAAHRNSSAANIPNR